MSLNTSKRSLLLARVGALAIIAAGAISVSTAKAAAEPVEFDMPAQSLDQALRNYGVVADKQVMFTADLVEGKTASPIKGEHTPSAALEILLADTGLFYETTSSNVILIRAEEGSTPTGTIAPFQTAQLQDAPARRTIERVGEEEIVDDDVMIADTIVVTGTNIRGIAADSSPSITFDKDDIDASGFLTTDEFIRSIPQNFGGGASNVSPFGFPDSSESATNNVLAAGVNIRGLDAGATLTLLNGRRLSPAGLNGGFVDVSSIPLGAVERVEILTDGASSIYGGDAVGGVVNFVMSEEFEGAETSLSYGLTTEGDRAEIRANQLLGTSWDSGNAFISYEYLQQDMLLANEKSFASSAPDPLSLLPEQERHSLVGNLSQQFGENIEFSLLGYYADRSTEEIFNRSFPDQPIERQPVQFEQGDAEQLLIAPSLAYEFGNDWQVVLAGDYSETNGDFARQDLDKTTNILGSIRTQRNEASQTSVDLIADGGVIELPGGTARVAIGAAYREEEFRFAGTSGNFSVDQERDVWAGFGELFIPVFGEANARPGLERLEISASVRYDEYSDFGSSTNPKLGLLWSPVEGLNMRGSYSTSFNPPDLGFIGNPDTSGSIFPTLNPDNGQLDLQYFLLAGNDVNSGPEESEAFTAGFDYTAELGGGELSISTTYYDISFDDRIGVPPLPPGLDPFNFLASADELPAESFTNNPSRAEVEFLIGLTDESGLGTFDVVELFTGSPADLDNIAFIVDFSTRNLSLTETDGIDFDVSYSQEVADGELTLGLAGNYILDFQNQVTSASPSVDGFNRVFNPVDFRARGRIGWSNARISANAFLNHTASYTNDRVDPFVDVDAWATLDFNFGYSFLDGLGDGPDALDGTRIALSVRNVFDEDPPFIESNDNFSVGFFDSANANPLGRFISVNLVKTW